jgi:hypothetical protein
MFIHDIILLKFNYSHVIFFIHLEGMSEEDFLHVEPLEDVPLPSLASISASTEFFPSLDDSIDVVTKMGTLQLRDLSPCLNT